MENLKKYFLNIIIFVLAALQLILFFTVQDYAKSRVSDILIILFLILTTVNYVIKRRE